jgi:dolichyl-phosphate beta-glucosyltransferase
MANKKVYLSVIIPCYNEEENLRRGVLKQVYKYMSTKDFFWEVIISDDGSSDKSVILVENEIGALKKFRHLRNPHGGKPLAIYYGLKEAKGEYVLFTDMDQSTPIGELDKLLPWVGKYEVIIGSRGISRKNFPIYRQLGALVFLAIRRSLILPEIKDTQCGFKLFKRNIVTKAFPKLEFFNIKQRTTGWKVSSYDVELLHIMKKIGTKIKEVVVDWDDRDASRGKGSGLSRYIRESMEMFMQILRVKLNDLRGKY